MCPEVDACTLDHYVGGDWYVCGNCQASPPPTPVPAPVPDPLACVNPAPGDTSNDLWGSKKATVNGFKTADPGWKPPGLAPNSTVCVAPPIPCTNNINASGRISGALSPSYCNVATSLDSNGTANNPQSRNISGSGAVSLRPGVYWGGIQITGNPTVTFQPGIYVMAGGGGNSSSNGGFRYTSTSANICPVMTCTGVTFFNTADPYANSGPDRNCGAINMSGGSLQVAAPTVAPYPVSTWPVNPSAEIAPTDPNNYGWKNMLFWQSQTCNPQMPFSYQGGGSGADWVTSGVIYMPKGELNVSGGAAFGAIQIVVNTFTFGGSKDIIIKYTNWIDTDLRKVLLVE